MSQFIKFYFTSSVLNMFRTLIHPSSGACDFYIVKMCVGVSVWLVGVVSVLQAEAQCCASACQTDTTPTSHTETPTHIFTEHTTNVVTQKKIRRLLMMDVLMSETC